MDGFLSEGALKGDGAKVTDRAQNRFSQIHLFSGNFKRWEGAGPPQVFAENRKFLQKSAGNCRQESVSLGPSPILVIIGISACAEGPERHLDAARQKLPRDNFCRSIAAQWAILKEEKMSSLVGERQFGKHLKRQFGRG